MIQDIRMLGGRNLHEMIENAIDDIYKNVSIKIDKTNSDRIHAIEASGCTRFAYYERKDSLPSDNAAKISSLLGNGMRHSLSNMQDRKSTRLNSSHANISYAVFCLKKKKDHHSELRSRH